VFLEHKLPSPLELAQPLEDEDGARDLPCGQRCRGPAQDRPTFALQLAAPALDPDEPANVAVARTLHPHALRSPPDAPPDLRRRQVVNVYCGNEHGNPRIVGRDGEAHLPRMPARGTPKVPASQRGTGACVPGTQAVFRAPAAALRFTR